MKVRRISNLLIVLAVMSPAGSMCAQESKPTIRHHRVAEEVPEDPITTQFNQAESAMQSGDFASAEGTLQKIAAAKPDNYRVWFDLGYVYDATHRTSEAVDAYRKAVSAKPDLFESNLNLGLLLAKQGDTEEAARSLKAATQLKPLGHPEESLSRAWQALGRVEQTSDPQLALVAFGEASKLTPKDPKPHLASGELLLRQNDLDAAGREYRAALEVDPGSRDALTGVVDVYIAQKKYPDADAILRKLLTANPQDAGLHIQQARVLAAEGKDEQASQELQLGLQADPGNPHAALELGTLYAKAGKDAEAEQQFRSAVQRLPRDPETHYALGSLLMHEKKYVEAQQELLAAINLKPDLGDAYGNLAVVAAANKDYMLSLRALDGRAKYLPEIPATYFLRATNFDNLKEIPQAVEYYQRFLAADAGKFPDQEWQARHRLIAIDPQHADKYRVKVKK
jgi:Flp pilus assembly protein TadD